ncbi:hypothetical protein [Amycolatopsis sp. cmx-4-83]|uniref:hypothetical protein n=1 Tax=Amycolatopsis sp. cmx-4-83 TaxID=2790940 RepID=UPI00397A6D58
MRSPADRSALRRDHRVETARVVDEPRLVDVGADELGAVHGEALAAPVINASSGLARRGG